MEETEERPGIARRLEAAGESVRASDGAHKADLVTRDRLIVEACDEGWGWAQVARWAGVSQARIQQVIASHTVAVD